MRGLRCSVAPDHLMPEDILAGANVVVVYFLPFTRELAATNCSGTLASPAWARAYAETNALFAELNDLLVDLIRSRGGMAVAPGFAGELCLFRQRGACGRCFARCPSGALSPEGFDRSRCFGVCLENAAVYPGCDVCGKCVTGVPCSFRCDALK